MGYILKWTETALQDIEEIAEYIHRDSPFYASVVVEKMMGRTRELPAQPLAGRVVPEAQTKSIREVLVYDYRLIYEVIEMRQEIVMLAVFHARRNVHKTLIERLD
ncbi:type II toxin-antitoxin system RelE/ParE family toxin [Lacimicrobium alkaliphilum]|uniref:Plasmid stabilization protein n=1 Tax=Lacimicrobium alkaliphilum TaxID=1526571 RepID=A0ABQ1RPT9_9ALTE|nr:type II toxin-antitoxin system RelE/ParE family toxin [Lacimicrobium alkaliphilum]GGD74042.1 hypothetical protein GCM10011357_31360 [Lacimicrobium alkaliphilum]